MCDSGTPRLFAPTLKSALRSTQGAQLYGGCKGIECELCRLPDRPIAHTTKALLEEIANDTKMILPMIQSEIDQRYEDVEGWIDSEWMTPDAYYTLHGW